jgi:hypothetical protein
MVEHTREMEGLVHVILNPSASAMYTCVDSSDPNIICISAIVIRALRHCMWVVIPPYSLSGGQDPGGDQRSQVRTSQDWLVPVQAVQVTLIWSVGAASKSSLPPPQTPPLSLPALQTCEDLSMPAHLRVVDHSGPRRRRVGCCAGDTTGGDDSVDGAASAAA